MKKPNDILLFKTEKKFIDYRYRASIILFSRVTFY